MNPRILSLLRPSILAITDNSLPTTESGGLADQILGTGFLLSDEGHVATALHVVEGSSIQDLRCRTTYTVDGYYSMGTWNQVEYVWHHPSLDLAILKVDSRMVGGRRPHALSSREAEPAESVEIVGFAEGTDLVVVDDLMGLASPMSITPVVTQGFVSAIIPHDSRPTNFIAVDATTFPGQSGAPYISSQDGTVLAVHTASWDQRMAYGIAVAHLRDFNGEVLADRVAPTSDPAGSFLLSTPVDPEQMPNISRDPEVTIRVRGKVWRVHQNDADPFPSNPHAHLVGSRFTLHLGSGELFIRTRNTGQQIGRAHLNRLRAELTQRGITPPRSSSQ